ncbi:MAG: FAD-binding oxidoreductase [Cyclobacteriaceae bacterium]|nr:FAD-binding oxidoreductase [Cyclobacteriaceae bacterium]
MIRKNADFILVGFGISGAVLAYKLIKKNYKILVYDTPAKNTSSGVAAGIYNPITGKNSILTWKAEELFPDLHDFYKQVEQDLNTKILYPIDQYRPFPNIDSLNNWSTKEKADPVHQFVDSLTSKEQFSETVINPFGGIHINSSGKVDIPEFIESVKKMVIQYGDYREEELVEEKVIAREDGVEYEDYVAKKIIFCNGYSSAKGKFFNWLPFKPVKGEILEIATNNSIPVLINYGVFILPLKDKKAVVGSTYDHDNLTTEITPSARNKLTEKLKKLYKGPFEIINQKAGIRPSTDDRRPFLGQHPKHRSVYIFNGLGTKGVSIAPHFADKFIDFIENEVELEKEVSIKRYFSLYFG